MRIIAGTWRSRPLSAPPGDATRPTSDRLRETLFNVLSPRIADAAFLDLYSGSGAVALEALSRGALYAVAVERAPAALKALRANLDRLGGHPGLRIVTTSVAAFLRNPAPRPFDLVFLDPPWDAESEYESALSLLGGASQTLIAPRALVIAEHRRKEKLNDSYGALVRTRLLEQGDAALSIYTLSAGPERDTELSRSSEEPTP